jgi:hypothetical protein
MVNCVNAGCVRYYVASCEKFVQHSYFDHGVPSPVLFWLGDARGSMKVTELKAELAARGHDTKGIKSVLLDRLKDALREEIATEKSMPIEQVADSEVAAKMVELDQRYASDGASAQPSAAATATASQSTGSRRGAKTRVVLSSTPSEFEAVELPLQEVVSEDEAGRVVFENLESMLSTFVEEVKAILQPLKEKFPQHGNPVRLFVWLVKELSDIIITATRKHTAITPEELCLAFAPRRYARRSDKPRGKASPPINILTAGENLSY